jgi:hypothetical protein
MYVLLSGNRSHFTATQNNPEAHNLQFPRGSPPKYHIFSLLIIQPPLQFQYPNNTM